MSQKNDAIKFYLFIGIIAVIIFYLLLNLNYLKSMLNINNLQTFFLKYKDFTIGIYLFIFVVKPFLVIVPSNVVALLGSTIFNPLLAFILTMIGFFISSTIAFFLARLLGKKYVEKIVGKKVIKLDENLRKNGFKIVLFLRLPPVIPYDPLSYACGLTNIRYKDFIIASLLGVVPETICYSIIGNNFNNPLSFNFLLPISLLVVTTLCAGIFINKSNQFNKS